MTKTKNLRPTLPHDMAPDLKTLIVDCWHEVPSLRPSFTVILLRLQGIRRASFGDRDSSRTLEDVTNSAVREVCQNVNGLLWDHAPAQWDQAKADILISNDCTTTARDTTLRKVLGSRKGPSSVKALGWLMFGGVEDGAEMRPEPVLDADIIVNHNESYALLKSRFSLINAAKIKQWRVKDTREFDGLQAALAASEKSIKSWGTGALQNTAESKDVDSGKAKRRLKRKVRIRKTKKKSKKDSRLENFIKAARFVRGYGAAAIHPSAKIELYGLRMQAQQGDCKQSDATTEGGDDESPANSLKRLKLEAWRSLKGMAQEAAMEQYLSQLTLLAPNWKVAHFLGRQNDDKRRKPREMMWVLKLGYKERSQEEMLSLAQSFSGRPSLRVDATRGLQITSVEIVQSSNSANAKLWSDESMTLEDTSGRTAESLSTETSALSEFDKFVAQLPKDFTLSDCIIDKSLYATIEEQRTDIGERMRLMARQEHDDEDGWNFYAKTIQNGVSEGEQLDVFAREVEWSSTLQLRTRMETDFGVEEVFEFLVDTFVDKIYSKDDVDKSKKSSKTLSVMSEEVTRAYTFSETAEDKSTITGLVYREFKFPW